MKLSDLKINRCAIILSLKMSNERIKRRLLEMGFVPGTYIKKTKIAPFGSPCRDIVKRV